MGHELCAVVEEIVDDCTLKAGDRIAYFHHDYKVAGHHYPGCFAEYILLPINTVAKMDPVIPDIEGPALQPFSACIPYVKEANVKIGETVAIFGQGVMGTNITQLCHLAGAVQIIGIDVRDECLRVARELGANITINASQQEPVQAILDLTGGKGVDVAFECASGSPEVGLSGSNSLFDAIGAIRQSGRLVEVSFFHDKVNLDPNLIRAKRGKYIFPDEATGADMEMGIQLVAQGKASLKPSITHVLKGIDKLTEAFDITANKAMYNAINPAVVVVST
jgi:threonine dehydrogenase-like Zn-dependent dehydrogenase